MTVVPYIPVNVKQETCKRVQRQLEIHTISFVPASVTRDKRTMQASPSSPASLGLPTSQPTVEDSERQRISRISFSDGEKGHQSVAYVPGFER